MFKVLTDLQAYVLTSLFKGDLGSLGYYLTGGTALSEFYLQHRHSDDLDLFTRERRPFKQDNERLLRVFSDYGIEVVSSEVYDELLRFFVSAVQKGEGQLKLEFARDVSVTLSPPTLHEGIVADSFEDIAANKISAILGREPPEVKDFVDLFFILTESNYSLDYLVSRAREKEAELDTELGTLHFATNLLRVADFRFLPRMIKPLSLDELKAFLLPIAQEMVMRMRPQRT